MSTRCNRCKKFARKDHLENVDGQSVHKWNKGCRVGEPVMTIQSVPKPRLTVDKTKGGEVVLHVVSVTSLADALIRAGVVEVAKPATQANA